MSEENKEASSKIHRKILDLIKAGKVEVSNPEALSRMKLDPNPDFTVTEVAFEFWDKGFVVRWGTKSAGFGEMSVWVNKEGKITIDNECMGREFLKSVFAKVVDDAVLTSEKEKK